MMKMVVTSVEKRNGYEIRFGHVAGMRSGQADIPVVGAYTPDGHYIGSPKEAEFIVLTKGIVPELRTPTSTVCSIGFCQREQKWYGWSHRAISGFGIGSIAQEGDACTESGLTIAVPVGFEAKTLDDARRMAIAFAESVS